MIRPTALPTRGYRSMTGGAGHKGAIRNSPSRPIEAILRLRIDTGARLETFGVTKGTNRLSMSRYYPVTITELD